MPQSSVDLANIFQSVTQALAENQQVLNQADEYNRDHGDNMVQTFQTITNALEQKKGSSPSTALNYAAKQLSKSTTSSSGQLYAQNLSQAAQPATQPGSGDMLGALLGGMTGGGMQQQAPQGGDDMLGALLGGLTGGGMQQQPSPSQAQPPQAGGDMLSTLLGGLTGAGGSSAGTGGGLSDGLGMDDLLNAGMAYFQAKQSGGSNTQALVQALLAGSGMGNSVHRNESTQIVVNTFLQALGSMNRRQ